MNISTYEARIKALEDQLNPPAPGGSTGLLSVTVTPDITLKDGTSLNAKLAEQMPIEPGNVINLDRLTSENVGTEYQVTATPGASWKAFSNPGSVVTFGEVGKPFTAEFDVLDGGFSITAGAMSPDVDPAGGQPLPEKLCRITFAVQK